MAKPARKIRRLKLCGFVVLLLIAGGLIYWFHFRPNHSPTRVVTVGTAIKPSVQASSSSRQKSSNQPPSNGTSAASNSGGATDTQGSTLPSSNSGQWTSSASGNITVEQPAPSAALHDGDSIVGKAKVNTVNYRLNDNEVGVIAQGTFNVVNGNFSGVLHFQPQGNGGRLDIFSTDSQGVEYNEVQINVSF